MMLMNSMPFTVEDAPCPRCGSAGWRVPLSTTTETTDEDRAKNQIRVVISARRVECAHCRFTVKNKDAQ